jgi:hypothetical protein
MLAAHFGVPLERVDFVVEGVFDPRGEFGGLGIRGPARSAALLSVAALQGYDRPAAPRAEIERIHERVLSHNMVLGAPRGIPQTSEQ